MTAGAVMDVPVIIHGGVYTCSDRYNPGRSAYIFDTPCTILTVLRGYISGLVHKFSLVWPSVHTYPVKTVTENVSLMLFRVKIFENAVFTPTCTRDTDENEDFRKR